TPTPSPTPAPPRRTSPPPSPPAASSSPPRAAPTPSSTPPPPPPPPPPRRHRPRRGGGVAVPTYSPDPFADFRRSMQEMVEAREVHDVRESWDYLHELLMCYLSLNPKSTHKFIVGAFADLLVSLMTEKGRRETPFAAGGECEVSRQCV
ncbi:transcription repressor ofp12, partial [Phtheirospermum japonicum]